MTVVKRHLRKGKHHKSIVRTHKRKTHRRAKIWPFKSKREKVFNERERWLNSWMHEQAIIDRDNELKEWRKEGGKPFYVG